MAADPYCEFTKAIGAEIDRTERGLGIRSLNLFLTPVLAFTIYFCFLHSIRHSITLIFELDKSFKSGLKKFINKAIPLTFVTSVW